MSPYAITYAYCTYIIEKDNVRMCKNAVAVVEEFSGITHH